MATYFCQTGGNDVNDGLDNIGVGLATATWTDAIFTLTQNGHGYTFALGDVIYIVSGTGATPGLYEVASSTANTIVLVETSTLPTVGNASDFAAGDLATGDIVSSDGPFLTGDQGMDTVAAGDHVFMRATADFTELLTIDTSGTNASWIVFEGYTTTLGDNGKATIDGGGARANGVVTAINGSIFYHFKNIIVENATSAGWAGGGAADATIFNNCEANSNGADGWDNWDRQTIWYNCETNVNTTNGFDHSAKIAHATLFCRSYADGNYGFAAGGSGVLCYGCVVSSAGARGIDTGSGLFSVGAVINCTIDGDAKDTLVGVEMEIQDFAAVIMNNIVYDCVTGISLHPTGKDHKNFLTQYNLLHSNTNPYVDQGNAGAGDQFGASNFTAEATQDYTLQVDSAAINKGIDGSAAESPGMDMGAHQSADAGGGGAGITKLAGGGGGLVG